MTLVLLVSCAKDTAPDCFKAKGKTITQERFPGFFDKVFVTSKIEVTIHKGNECKVELMAGGALLKDIKTTVKNNELIIEDFNGCNFVRGYKHKISARVTMPYVRLATNEGVSQLTFEEGFTQDTLSLRLGGVGDIVVNGTFKQLNSSTHGNGDVHLAGSTNNLAIYANGTGYVRAQNLNVKGYAFVASHTIGDVLINGEGLDQLDCILESDGNLIYRGEPGEIKNLSNSGAKGKIVKE